MLSLIFPPSLAHLRLTPQETSDIVLRLAVREGLADGRLKVVEHIPEAAVLYVGQWDGERWQAISG